MIINTLAETTKIIAKLFGYFIYSSYLCLIIKNKDMLTKQLRELERQADAIEQAAKFEKLPKNEQDFRWQLFTESDGYRKNLSQKAINQIAKEFNVNLKK